MESNATAPGTKLPLGDGGPSVSGLIWRSLASVFFSSENQQRVHKAADKLGITPVMFKALMGLEPGEERPMRDLASQWRCDASFVTVLVDGLEERGLARRLVLPTDRRVKTVQLTAKGIAAREEVMGVLSEPMSGLAALAETEQRELARLLTKLADAQTAADHGWHHHR